MAGGQGSQSSLGVGTETTPGTGVVPTMTIPILSESFSADNPGVPSESIVGDSMVQSVGTGLEEATGGVEMEFDGVASGQMLYYWSGHQGYTSATWAHGAPATCTAGTASSGTLPAGTYQVKVCMIYKNSLAADNRNQLITATAAASVAVNGSQKIAVSWSAPTPPTGWTWVGTAIYRGVADEATGNEKFVKYVAASATSQNIDTADAQDTNVSPFTATITRHVLKGTPPTSGDRLKTFSTTIHKNVSVSERYVYCMANDLNWGAASPRDKINFGLGIICQKLEDDFVANPTPSFTPREPFMGWTGLVLVDGSKDCTMESFNIQMSNGVSKIDSLCSQAYSRSVISAGRTGNGTVTRQHEDKAYMTRMKLGTEFAMRFFSFGQPLTASGCNLNLATHGIAAVPFRHRCEWDAYRCKVTKANAPITGPGPIKENIEFMMMKDLSQATEMQWQIWNTTSAYS